MTPTGQHLHLDDYPQTLELLRALLGRRPDRAPALRSRPRPRNDQLRLVAPPPGRALPTPFKTLTRIFLQSGRRPHLPLGGSQQLP
jgi:hypothetical protein